MIEASIRLYIVLDAFKIDCWGESISALMLLQATTLFVILFCISSVNVIYDKPWLSILNFTLSFCEGSRLHVVLKCD